MTFWILTGTQIKLMLPFAHSVKPKAVFVFTFLPHFINQVELLYSYCERFPQALRRKRHTSSVSFHTGGRIFPSSHLPHCSVISPRAAAASWHVATSAFDLNSLHTNRTSRRQANACFHTFSFFLAFLGLYNRSDPDEINCVELVIISVSQQQH